MRKILSGNPQKPKRGKKEGDWLKLKTRGASMKIVRTSQNGKDLNNMRDLLLHA